MKKIFFLISTILLFAQELTYINPYDYNLSLEQNYTLEQNTTAEKNETKIEVEEVVIEENFKTFQPKINIAVLIDKNKFFKFIPSIVNSINSYFLNKEIQFNIEVFNIDSNISKIKEKYNDIIVYSLDKNFIKNLDDNKTNFYIPLFNKKDIDINSTNFYFGGIDYKSQIEKFIEYMDTNEAVAINDNTLLSQKLFKLEKDFNLSLIKYDFPQIYYKDLNQSYVFLNIGAGKSAQVLSNITSKEIETKLIFAPQIDYNPLIIEITQPQDITKLLIANSILNVPNQIEDTNLNLNSDIKYNWLNYATNILLNKIYNKYTQNDLFYMNDFGLYIFNNQINYKTKLYQIIKGAFTPIK